MRAIFFKNNGEFNDVMPNIFKALGIRDYHLRDSTNALGGVYGIFSIFGSKIKVEKNSYDYEDDYQYSIFIEKDVLSKVQTTNNNIDTLTNIIADILYRNLHTEVAIEVDNKLIVYNISEK